MYASEVKKETVERQYNYVISSIEKYMGLESRIEPRIPIDITSICDDTIDLLLMEGFDILKITYANNIVRYEVSWQNSVDGEKGEIKFVNVNEEW